MSDSTRARERLLLDASHPHWPMGFDDLHRAPSAVEIDGRTAVLARRPKVAIVGARRSTATGREMARRLARDLAAHGIVIVSGLARGIDSAAHLGALDVGGETVAVLGTGLDRRYPPGSQELHERIARSGALVSEFEPDAEPRREHFPQRNRLIAAMSEAVIVVEGGERSGSRITADFALELGRDVLAVPRDPLADGAEMPNRLLKEGAIPVTDVGDVWLVLAWPGERPSAASSAVCTREALRARVPAPLRAVYDALGPSPIGVDELARTGGWPIARVQRDLIELEMGHHVTRETGGYRRKSG